MHVYNVMYMHGNAGMLLYISTDILSSRYFSRGFNFRSFRGRPLSVKIKSAKPESVLIRKVSSGGPALQTVKHVRKLNHEK